MTDLYQDQKAYLYTARMLGWTDAARGKPIRAAFTIDGKNYSDLSLRRAYHDGYALGFQARLNAEAETSEVTEYEPPAGEVPCADEVVGY